MPGSGRSCVGQLGKCSRVGQSVRLRLSIVKTLRSGVTLCERRGVVDVLV